MWNGTRVLVTGGRGFLGSHMVSVLTERGADVVPVGSADADLRAMDQALDLLESVRPQVVVHCAVQGGGIGWMKSHPVESGRDNVLINVHTLDAATAFHEQHVTHAEKLFSTYITKHGSTVNF